MGITDIMQPTHLLFILVVALLVLGPKRLPEVGRHLGNGLRDFRNAISGERESLRESFNFDSEPRHPVVEESFSYDTDHGSPTGSPAAAQPSASPTAEKTAPAPSESPAHEPAPGHDGSPSEPASSHPAA